MNIAPFMHEHPWMTYFLAAALIYWIGTFLVTLAGRGKVTTTEASKS